ncbi:nucleotide-diphosphate-sugar epimerase [Amycolatopsis sp. NBRC 101858]|uniref:SDR family oxidoreductase n=1 Tax=Amycolatopsis sp. NBRC 101858 TaxID=3032200 RepID=UPI0024A57FBE|nr:NAD(P)H-binding protein [Amycolatopsis sp. NBRC 101858]GLY43573.1 nucleotide-diphosphate-sugar epimerase [Amycolatopsis sp. NBRC 101858]
MTILVTGARGNVARALVGQLLEDGHAVRAAGRDPERTRLPAGVEVVAADLARPENWDAALVGVTQAFLYAGTAGLGGFLARAGGLTQVVLLSALGADPASEDAITRAHGEAEQVVRDSGIPWSFLRPGGFAANRLLWSDSVRAGVVRDPFPDSHSALVHEADIAAVAACALTSPGHLGATHTLTGPESLTVRDQVSVLGRVAGRPVRVETQDLDDYRRELTAAFEARGLGRVGSAEVIEARIRRLAALVDRPQETTETVLAVTGRPARSFAEWAGDHAEDFA